MPGLSWITVSWDLGSDRFRWGRFVSALLRWCFGPIGRRPSRTLETLPNYLRRDVGLLPRQPDLPQRDVYW